jgi:hypothetical protein
MSYVRGVVYDVTIENMFQSSPMNGLCHELKLVSSYKGNTIGNINIKTCLYLEKAWTGTADSYA